MAKFFALFALVLAVCLTFVDCKPATGPTADAEAGAVGLTNGVDGKIEAGVQIANGVCSLLEGVDDSGVVRTVCATVDEVASVVAFILTLRTADAGVLVCSGGVDGGLKGNVKIGAICSSSTERAKAVQFLAKVRASRFVLDGGLGDGGGGK